MPCTWGNSLGWPLDSAASLPVQCLPCIFKAAGDFLASGPRLLRETVLARSLPRALLPVPARWVHKAKQPMPLPGRWVVSAWIPANKTCAGRGFWATTSPGLSQANAAQQEGLRWERTWGQTLPLLGIKVRG